MNKRMIDLLESINEHLDSIENNINKILNKLDKKIEPDYECKHIKKEDDEVLKIFSELIDDLDHVTIIKRDL